MDTFTYGGEKAETLHSADTLVRLGRTVMPQRSDRSLDRNGTDAASYFSSLIQPGTRKVYHAPAIRNAADGNQPDLAVHTPELYQFLKSRFEGKIQQMEEDTKKNKERNEEYKKKAENAKNDALKVDEGMEGKGGDITDGHGGEKMNAGTVISSIAGVVSNVLNGGGDKLRDKVYVCEYIMDMFSYSTINLEEKGRQKNDGKEQGKEQEKKSKKDTVSDKPGNLQEK